MFWQFYQTQPTNSSLVSGAHSAMHYAEMIIFALVEILHAFIVTDSSYVSMITKLYVQLLLCQVRAFSVDKLFCIMFYFVGSPVARTLFFFPY